MTGSEERPGAVSPASDRCRVISDWREGGAPSEVVATAVAAAIGADRADLPPLEDAVDTSLLDRFVREGLGELGSEATLSFGYAGAEVTLEGFGSVHVVVPEDRWDDDWSADEFRRCLRELLRSARQSDLSATGGWAVRDGDEGPDWQVTVSRVAAPGD